MERKIVITEDGSSTLYLDSIQECYHSHFGAIQEAHHIFIKQGLQLLVEKGYQKINILEVGFGTGLNCFLTLCHNEPYGASIYYEGIEKFPLKEHEVSLLNYPHLIVGSSPDLFLGLHQASWNTTIEFTDCFNLHKRDTPFENTKFIPDHFDLVYFDPFSPDKQPEMWQKDLLVHVYQAMKPNGILLTYCTKGIVKRAMKEVGFGIEKLPGPIGKREILRATKQ